MEDLERGDDSIQPCKHHCVNVADKAYLKRDGGYRDDIEDCKGCAALFSKGIYTQRPCVTCLGQFKPKRGEDLDHCDLCATLLEKVDAPARALIERMSDAILFLYNNLS